jgi:diguanylate cyclase (GGDEF)-like protein/putative nucleotidyltransferase with HDIG domain
MQESSRPRVGSATAEPAPSQPSAAEGQIAEISSLLNELDERGTNRAALPRSVLTRAQENDLVQVRLGVATGLFTTLRAKHEPTAQHCLRVALGLSTWAEKIGLSHEQRDEIELAALLHDIGKIGIPDNILMKPGSLTSQEMSVMDGHWQIGNEILRSCCVAQGVLDMVSYARSWFDGTKGKVAVVGDRIPLGARMLSIVDAFDAMMSDHVYRPAMSLERAHNELYRNAGTQFDPSLVLLFIKLYELDEFRIQTDVSRRWLEDLSPSAIEAPWRRNESLHWNTSKGPQDLFQQKLLDNMYDAVIFIDNTSRVTLWNRGAERLTGVPGPSMYQRLFLPSLLRMRDEKGRLIKDEECPVAHAIQSGVQWLHRLTIRGRNGRDIAVDAQAAPVISSEGVTHGLTLLLHDASPEISLEERCQSLHDMATKDPLTQVANRAEFDRVLDLFVAAHLESKRPCALIMSDIDRFKHVNDTYGHQAGDAIIQSFARLLQNSCRAGDLVARYGGEEFAMLCAECDNTTAARRAEEIRLAFSELRQSMMDGRCATASFGVTEVQAGDTPDTMLRRSDRALLQAKETGRNRVVQLGAGCQDSDAGPAGTVAKGPKQSGHLLLAQDLVTQSPIDRSIEKLRGFIADHHGEVVSTDGTRVQIKLGGHKGSLFGANNTASQVRLLMDLTFTEDRGESPEPGDRRQGGLVKTRIHCEISPQKSRDRRKLDAVAHARQMLISLRSYLMAMEAAPRMEVDTSPEPSALSRAASFFLPWKRKRFTESRDDR